MENKDRKTVVKEKGRLQIHTFDLFRYFQSKIKTRLLFELLVWLRKADLVCDVGSMDGEMSAIFSRLVPDADIYAFEANPFNFKLMEKNANLKRSNVRLINKAVWVRNGRVLFYIVPFTNKDPPWKKGISSTRQRIGRDAKQFEIRVQSVRLDDFVRKSDKTYQNIALWIDVEGASYEVLKGMEEIKDNVFLIHVEVEARQRWLNQKTESDVMELLRDMNFHLLSRGYHPIQHDLVCINRRTYEKNRIEYDVATFLARFFSYVIGLVGGIVPSRFRSLFPRPCKHLICIY